MANLEFTDTGQIGAMEDRTAVKLFCSAFGAVLAVLGDLMNNERASLLIKLREVLKTYASPQFEDTFVVILFVVAISLCLFVVRPPKGRGEAFAQGLAVFAVFTTLAPYKPIPISQAEFNLSAVEPPSIMSFLVSPAMAGSQPAAYRKTVTIRFDGDRAPPEGARVIIRDARSGLAFGQRMLNEARNEVTIAAPRGIYDLYVEADGYERTRTRVAIDGPNEAPSAVFVARSAVPLPLQLLYRPTMKRAN